MSSYYVVYAKIKIEINEMAECVYSGLGIGVGSGRGKNENLKKLKNDVYKKNDVD